ncbi:MAG: ATP-binding cassette domain-containing protein [Syntrophobacteraceae bacterium]|jgi:ABC-2 type transport system ATP-binding protein
MVEHALGSDILSCEGLTKEFMRGPKEKIKALDSVTLRVARGAVTGLIGPDGAGKTTLIRIATGLFAPEAGSIRVLGIDVATDPRAVQSRVGYMPQRFGLYEDLTVQENLDLYANLHGISPETRSERYPQLMQMTGLGPFKRRLAGQLSGGMKQKLGLACTLVSTPDLLLLDEPTVGVDPLSRRELWEIVYRLVREQGLTVLLSTSYLEEAERCEMAVLLLRGRVLASGPPSQISSIAAGRSFRIDTPESLKPRQLQAALASEGGIVDATLEGRRVRIVTSGAVGPQSALFQGLTVSPVAPRFEDGFMTLVRQAPGPGLEVHFEPYASSRLPEDLLKEELVVEVHNLTRKFGSFIAVNNVTFQVGRGEIFGLLGPNGAGKSTTFRMLCGLLPASSGTLSVAGMDLRYARASARQRIGYVAQKFSLYRQLTVMENLKFFAGAYGLRGSSKSERLDWAIEQFDLRSQAGLTCGGLPEGYKQRLAMACALMHQPEILFLDEPTSGVDPLARREFWRRISTLADQGVTVIVTTHFMEEAEYCDHMVIMVDGRVLATGTPADIRGRASTPQVTEPTMEDAFVAIVEEYRVRSEK